MSTNANVKWRINVLAGLLLGGLALLIIFNFSTTYETLNQLFGGGMAILVFSISFSLVDFAGIARVLTPDEDIRDEPPFIWLLFGVWLIAALIDIITTWWWATLRMQAYGGLNHLPTDMAWMASLLPWGIAISEFCIRVPLVILIGQYGERWFKAMRNPISGKSEAKPERREPVFVGSQKMPAGMMPLTRPQNGGLKQFGK